jgi:hypothetical protein
VGSPAAWFIPFVLVLVLLTAPLAFRDPVVSFPAILAATGFAAHLMWRDYRSSGALPHPLLSALFLFLALVTAAMTTLAILALL